MKSTPSDRSTLGPKTQKAIETNAGRLLEVGLEAVGRREVASFTELADYICGTCRTALILGLKSETQALEALAAVEDLLIALDLEFDALQPRNPYHRHRPVARQQHGPWRTSLYRNVGGDGVDVQTFEYRVAGITLTVRQFLKRGTLSAEEESCAAS